MIVFLDVDDVLANFCKAACEILNVPYPPSKWRWYEDIPNGFERLNNACDILFWKFLEWMPDGKEILAIVESYFHPENIYLLTTPMPNSGSGTGKMLWVKKHIPQYYERLIISTAPKHLLARPDTLLIDDRGENVIEFRKAGGEAILVPRSWNNFCFSACFAVSAVGNRIKAISEEENAKSSCNR